MAHTPRPRHWPPGGAGSSHISLSLRKLGHTQVKKLPSAEKRRASRSPGALQKEGGSPHSIFALRTGKTSSEVLRRPCMLGLATLSALTPCLHDPGSRDQSPRCPLGPESLSVPRSSFDLSPESRSLRNPSPDQLTRPASLLDVQRAGARITGHRPPSRSVLKEWSRETPHLTPLLPCVFPRSRQAVSLNR